MRPADRIESAVTEGVVDIAGAVAGQTRELNDGEQRAFYVPPVSIQQAVQPLRRMVRIDCLMNASVKRNPSRNATQSPGPRAGGGDARSNPVAERDLFRGVQVLEGRRKTNHLIETFGLNALGLWLTLRLTWETSFELRLEKSPHVSVALFDQSACDPAPHNPEFHPHRLFLVKCHARTEQRFDHLRASPIIQRIAETRTQRVSGKLEPNALMIGRSAPLSRAGVECAPHLSQHWYAPLLTRPEYLLETAPELSDLHWRTRCRASRWLSGERLFDVPARLGEMGRHRFDDGVFCGACRAAKFKL